MRMRRLAALLVAAVLFVTAFALPASAEGFTYTWEEGKGGPHSKALFMLNLDTDTVVYSMNADEAMPMASMTKIMSYIVAYENIPDIETAVITVPESVSQEMYGTYSSEAGIVTGEQLTGLQLLNLMMIPSGNDAALTLAKHVDALYAQGTIGQKPAETPSEGGEEAPKSQSQPTATAEAAPTSTQGAPVAQGLAVQPGGEPKVQPMAETQATPEPEGGTTDPTEGSTNYADSYFVKLMNEKAAALGCENTNFTNPHGLHHANHYTTARDMMKIAKYAMTLPNFTEITSATYYQLPPTNMRSDPDAVTTTNRLLLNAMGIDGYSYYYQSATGIKTGSLNESGYCITASATAYGYTYLVVAMGSPMVDAQGNDIDVHGEMLDCIELFRWALSSLEKRTVVAQGELVGSVKLEYAWRKDTLQVVAGDNASAMLPASVVASSIEVKADLPEKVQAPVKKGDALGTATLYYADEALGTISLVAGETVEKSSMIQMITQGKDVITSPWFLVVISIVLVLIIIYIILVVLYRKKQKKLRKVRRFRDM